MVTYLSHASPIVTTFDVLIMPRGTSPRGAIIFGNCLSILGGQSSVSLPVPNLLFLLLIKSDVNRCGTFC